MSWIQIFVASHVLTAGILTFLLGIALTTQREQAVVRAFAALVAAFLAWVLLNGASTLLTINGSPSDLIGSFAGLSVVALGYAALAFGEFFPQSLPIPYRRQRLLVAAAISIPVGLSVFSPHWMSNRTFSGGAATATITIPTNPN